MAKVLVLDVNHVLDLMGGPARSGTFNPEEGARALVADIARYDSVVIPDTIYDELFPGGVDHANTPGLKAIIDELHSYNLLTEVSTGIPAGTADAGDSAIKAFLDSPSSFGFSNADEFSIATRDVSYFQTGAGSNYASNVVSTQDLMEAAVKDGTLSIHDYKTISTESSPGMGSGGWTDWHTVAVEKANAAGVDMTTDGNNFILDTDGNPTTTSDHITIESARLLDPPSGAGTIGEALGATGEEATAITKGLQRLEDMADVLGHDAITKLGVAFTAVELWLGANKAADQAAAGDSDGAAQTLAETGSEVTLGTGGAIIGSMMGADLAALTAAAAAAAGVVIGAPALVLGAGVITIAGGIFGTELGAEAAPTVNDALHDALKALADALAEGKLLLGGDPPASPASPTTPLLPNSPDSPPNSPTILPPSDPMNDLKGDFESGSVNGCPLVMDISGNGIALTQLGQSGQVYWDISSEGVRHATAWTTGGTGLLAIDLNGNGKIDNNGELFGNQPASGVANGFQALAAYDGNSDGVIDANDAQFGNLRVWIDANNNGVTEAGELKTLTELNITSIDLGFTSANYQISGNDIKQESTFVIDGETRSIVDAWLAYDSMNTIYNGSSYALNPFALFAPQQRGYGVLPDLYISMSKDDTLLEMVDDLASKTARELFTESYDLRGKLQAIMYEWAGVTGNASNASPWYGTMTDDTRRLDFLNEITGSTLSSQMTQTHFGQTWDLAVGIIGGNLLLQSGLGPLFGNPIYNSDTDTFVGGGLPEGETVFRFIPLEDYSTAIYNSTYNDVYVVMPGDMAVGGHTIIETLTGGTDTLLIGGVDVADVHMWTNGDGGLVVQYTDSDQITIAGALASNGASTVGSYVERIMFDDGTTWDLTQGLHLTGDDTARSLNGSNQADTLIGGVGGDHAYGNDGNDVLTSMGGTAYLEGDVGDDTYLFGATAAGTSVQIWEATGEGNDTVRVDANAADTHFWVDAYGVGHLVLDGDSADVALLHGTMTGAGADLGSRIEHIVFNDSSLDLTAGLTESDTSDDHELDGSAGNDVLRGNGGDDALYGYDGNDTLDGGDGNNSLHGDAGNDTYLFADTGGATIDHIYETPGSGDDTIRIDANQADVRVYVDYSDVAHVVFAGDSTHEMWLQTSFSNGSDFGSRIEHIVFNDGSWNLTNGLIETDTDASHALDGSTSNDTMSGFGGDDTLWGYAGEDTLAGGDGLDHLHGGSGADTFVFDHVTAYNNVDVVSDFSVSDGDKLDLRDLLAAYDPMTDVLSDFVKVEDDGSGGTAVSVDQDGTGTGHDWVQIATLSGVTGLDADTLASTGHLLVA